MALSHFADAGGKEQDSVQTDNIFQVQLPDKSVLSIRAPIGQTHNGQRQTVDVSLYRHPKGRRYFEKGSAIWATRLVSVDYVPGDDRRYALVNVAKDRLFIFFMWDERYFIISSKTGEVIDKGVGDGVLRTYHDLVPLRLIFASPSTGRTMTDQELKEREESEPELNAERGKK
jgi:hypothetical protein